MCSCYMYGPSYRCSAHKSAPADPSVYAKRERRASALGKRLVTHQLLSDIDFANDAVSRGLISEKEALEYMRKQIQSKLDTTTAELFAM